MNYTIKDVYKVNYQKNEFNYVGTLRNERQFNVKDNVFFAYGNEIFRGKVVGVELPPRDNASYIYKIQLPEELIARQVNDMYNDPPLDHITMTCERVFANIEQAKESAIRNTEHTYKLQKDEIERYFKQFEEPPTNMGAV